jgi:hypothetical protein
MTMNTTLPGAGKSRLSLFGGLHKQREIGLIAIIALIFIVMSFYLTLLPDVGQYESDAVVVFD